MYNIIVPTYNEKENIRVLLHMLSDVMKEIGGEFKIIVVDDSSPDGTHSVVESMNLPNLLLLQRKKKLGLGTAYRAALEHCEFPFTIVMDADLSHDPMYIKKMVSIQKKGADIVIGTRYVSGGGVYGWSVMRKIISHGANSVAKVVLNIDASDLTGSYRLYKTETFRFLIGKSVSTGYSFQMELLYLASKHGFRISECPIVFHDRTRGASKLSLVEVLLYAKTVALLFFTL